MFKRVDFYEFRDDFKDIRPDNFSNEGLSALYDYLTDWEEEIGEESELDVIAICSDFSEYNSVEEAYEDLIGNYEELGEDDEEREEEALSELESRTTVIPMDNGGIIIQRF